MVAPETQMDIFDQTYNALLFALTVSQYNIITGTLASAGC